jgi:hypothetical protein
MRLAYLLSLARRIAGVCPLAGDERSSVQLIRELYAPRRNTLAPLTDVIDSATSYLRTRDSISFRVAAMDHYEGKITL